jgi:serine/threonine protein kinase
MEDFDTSLLIKIQQHYRAKIKSISRLAAGERGKIFLITLHSLAGESVKICLKSDQNCERSKQESELAKIVYKNPGIYYKTQKISFYTMPFFEGFTLSKLTPQQYDISQRANIVLAIAKQLNNIRERGIIHRDLKPDNILIQMTENKTNAEIIDFGRSVQVISNKGKVHDFLLKLSLNNETNFFMRLFRKCRLLFQKQVAPEYVRDDRQNICYKSDAFALANIVGTWLPEFQKLKKMLEQKIPQERINGYQLALFLEKILSISKQLPNINMCESPLVDIIYLKIDPNLNNTLDNKQRLSIVRFLYTHAKVLEPELGTDYQAIYSSLREKLPHKPQVPFPNTQHSTRNSTPKKTVISEEEEVVFRPSPTNRARKNQFYP